MQTLIKQLRQRAETALNSQSKEELHRWRTSPITKSLLYTLEADKLSTAELWTEGTFTGETCDQTAQLSASAIGKTQGMDDVIEWIEELGQQEENDEQI